MPLNMPATLTAAKNQLSQPGAWVWLLTVTLPEGGPTLRYAANAENVVYGGDTYTAFSFAIDSFSCNADGEIPEFTMSVTNVGYVLQEYIRMYNGLIGGTISFVQVNTSYLAEDYSEDLTTLTIVGAQNTWPNLELTLSVPAALRYRVPEDRYNPHACRHAFRTPDGEYTSRCGYTGANISGIALAAGLPVSVTVPAVAAQGSLTLAINPTSGDTMTIGTVTYRFRATLAQANDIKIGATLAATQASIVKTLNGTGVAGTDYYAGTTTPHPTVSAGSFAANASVLTARTAGVAGNAIVTTETFVSAANLFNGATLGKTTLGWQHGFLAGDKARLYDIVGISGLAGDHTVTPTGLTTFTLDGTNGSNYSGSFISGKAGYAHCKRIPSDCEARGRFPNNYGGPLGLRREAVRYA